MLGNNPCGGIEQSKKSKGEPPGLAGYSRARDLPRLIPVTTADLAGEGRPDAIVRLIERALRGERRRAGAGSWDYDPARHASLLRALRHETARLRQQPGATMTRPVR